MTNRINREGVLLILPPFGSFYDPYISLASLSGYLKSRNIPVSVYNCSASIIKEYPDEQKRADGVQAIQQCFNHLNRKKKLSPSEAAQLTVIYPLLDEIATSGLEKLSPETVLQICAFPFWPHALVKRPLLRLISDGSIFASDDLLRAGQHDYFFTKFLQQKLATLLLETTPLLAGVSTVFDEQAVGAIHCAKLIKSIDPNLHITIGGPFITSHMDTLHNHHFFKTVDSIIRDEGEIPLEILHTELSSKNPDFSKVPGMIYLEESSEISSNTSILPPDMETLPVTDYKSCQLESYIYPPRQMQLSIRLSRGCYWKQCSFCRVSLSYCKNFQQPSVEKLFNELRYLVKTTDVHRFMFSDESSNPLVLEKLSQKIIAEKLNIKWSFHTRVDKKLTRNRVELYKQAGCHGFSVGIETFSDRLLRLLKKGITKKLIHQVLQQIKGVLPVNAYMMVGIPGETAEEADLSYKTIQEYIQEGLLATAPFFLFQLTPGSEMWINPEKFHIEKKDIHSDNDLKPNLCAGFTTSKGMDRQKAFTKFLQFNYPRHALWKKQKHNIILAGEKTHCNYPMGYLQDFLSHLLIWQNDMGFHSWLSFIDQQCDAIKPYLEQE